MEKEFDFDKENPENNMISEPAIEYGIREEIKVLPPLTKEELQDCITGDELMEYMKNYIHELFNKK